MPTILEPICSGIVVALFNKYILGTFDPPAACSTACAKEDDGKKDDDERASSPNTSVTPGTGHPHMHF